MAKGGRCRAIAPKPKVIVRSSLDLDKCTHEKFSLDSPVAPFPRRIMSPQVSVSLLEHFTDLPDPRIDRSRLHNLLDIIALTICAVLSGADNWAEVERYGRRKYDWLKTFLALPNGIPSHDTIGRVFALLDPRAFQSCFLRWVGAV